MSKYKCVLFDLDGTIIDSSEGVKKSISESIEILGLPQLTESQLESCIGPPIQRSFKVLYEMDEKQANDSAAVFRNIYKDKYLFDAIIYDGIVDLIKALKREGVKVMIATYKREDYMRILLEKFELLELFDNVKGADFEGKLNKSDIIRMCIAESGCDVRDVVMVGDTIHDQTAAENVGIDFVAVTYGFGFKKPDKLENVTFVADYAKDMEKFFVG